MTKPDDAGAREFVVPSDEVSLHCSALGRGPTVLLLHAGGERRGVWRPVCEDLAARGFHAVAADQRAHGDSRGPAPDRLEAYARDVQALVAALPAPIAVVGASLGGLAALLALHEPNTAGRVNALTLVDVVPDPTLAESARAHLRNIETKIGRPFPWALIEDILAHWEEAERTLANLPVPISLVRGASGLVPRASVERFLQRVPSARVEVVENAGHLVARDQPHALAAILADILQGSAKSAFG